MAETLRLAGFDTAAVGKMHFNSDLSHGFDLRVDLADHRRWLSARPKKPPPPDVQPPWRPFRDPARVWLNSACQSLGESDAEASGTYLARRAAEYITAARARPFFLVVSFYEPHSPFRFPPEFRGRHGPSEFDLPELGPDDARQVPAVFRDLTDAEKRGIQAAYYTSVEYLDKNVGIVLDALDAAGAADDTIVAYLGDHGYMLGQHGRFEKHTSYEEAVRVPLIIRYPRKIGAGRVSHAFVELVDLVPTIYNLCDYKTTAPLQGRSLRDLLAGKTTKHREHVIVEYAPNEEVMIRDQYWKLVYQRGVRRRTDGYDTGEPLVPNVFRLYDLFADPHELHNVAGHPKNAEVVKRLTDLLVDHLTRTARQPELVPAGDALTILDYCVQSRDVAPSKR
jgi:choline-sulfatase